MRILLALAMLSCVASGQTSGPAEKIPANYFGITINHFVTGAKPTTPWPTQVRFGTIRSWDSNGSAWAEISTSDGNYNFAAFDKWLEAATDHGLDAIYTFGRTPSWASSAPSITCQYGPGQCAPPNDLQPDGSGSNQHWKDFVTAIVKHSEGRVRIWELWNESNDVRQWKGTNAQLVRMAKDASEIIRRLDPAGILTTPTPGAFPERPMVAWLNEYLEAGGAQYADAVSFHGYIGDKPAETIVLLIAGLRKVREKHGLEGKPLWNTEGSWARNTHIADPDDQAAFLARYYLLQWAGGVSRFCWYAYDNTTWGTLWDSQQGLNKAGRAYKEVYLWMVGATMDEPCAAHGNVWSCNFTRPGGYRARAVWSVSEKSTLRLSSLRLAPEYGQYADVEGNRARLKNGEVPIGPKPILIENMTAIP